MKKIATALFMIACSQKVHAVKINNKDIVFKYDEEPFVHQFRHANALEKALKNATDEEKEQLSTELEGQKEYHGDWNHIDGPDDSDTPLYYRTEVIDKIFKEHKKMKALKDKEIEERKDAVVKAASAVFNETVEEGKELLKKKEKKKESKEEASEETKPKKKETKTEEAKKEEVTLKKVDTKKAEKAEKGENLEERSAVVASGLGGGRLNSGGRVLGCIDASAVQFSLE